MGAVVALATASSCRHLDEDLDTIAGAIEALGAEARILCWDDAGARWDAVDAAVIRSTWDYPQRLGEFMAWVDRAASATWLLNPARVVRWNSDKHYLRDLATVGVPVAPTLFFEPGDRPHVPPGVEVVVKPAVSAGALDTSRHPPSRRADALAHLQRILDSGRSAMLQPYLDGVEQSGETAVVFLDGEVSHALRKAALLVPGVETVEGLYLREEISPHSPSAAELLLADRALEGVESSLPGVTRDDLLYARVDLVPGPDGEPVLLELELIEPSIFCAAAPSSAERFAAAIVSRL